MPLKQLLCIKLQNENVMKNPLLWLPKKKSGKPTHRRSLFHHHERNNKERKLLLNSIKKT